MKKNIIIEQFVEQYIREYDYYEQSSRLLSRQIELRLQSAGIRAIVTARAKNPSRLKDKIYQRDEKRKNEGLKRYSSIEDIREDIVDMAGVRIALYFPGDITEIDRLLKENFHRVAHEKKFEANTNQMNGSSTYEKRFAGYRAKHYRMELDGAILDSAQKRYAGAKIEVQVASVLMHAWAEVEHDLIYKPLQGNLSEDELAILDEINGMVLAGEIALERLQRAVNNLSGYIPRGLPRILCG
jgi:ppGpp synthetase/RelA/SpoT-type nucleotidyltranferase